MPEDTAVPRPQARAEKECISCSSPDSLEFEHGNKTLESDSSLQNYNHDTSETEMKLLSQSSLLELRCQVEEAIIGNYIYGSRGNPKKKDNLQDIKLWGIPLLPSKGHQGTDAVLMKFLKAKDYRVAEALSMLCKVMRWRKDFKVDQIADEKMCAEFESMWRINGTDKEGRPLCYLSFRDLKNRELKKKLLRADGKLEEFLRWRIQCLERAIQKLDFSPGGTTSLFQITDLKNAPRQSIRELRWLCKKLLTLVHEHYPGIVYKNLIVNVPLWIFAVNAITLRQITARSKNMFIFVRSAKVTKTLLKYVNPENLLALYGGLKRENDREFSAVDKVLELNVRANTLELIKIPASEAERTVTWDVGIVGHEVTYKAEFIPMDECSYSVLLEKEKRMGKAERSSFYIREPGHIVITIGNGAFKRRKVFYRYTSKPCVPGYAITK